MHLKSYRSCSIAAIVAGLACAPSLACAQSLAPAPLQQQAPPPASSTQVSPQPKAPPISADAEATGVQEVVVTAQRRSESVQNVPISIVAVTGDSLIRAGITSLDGIQRLAPGLTTTTVGSGFVSYTFIRGGGTNNVDPGSDPSVAYFIDEIYVGGAQGLQFDLFDVDHVEVLKGPQGTLFGRNAASGAISVITKRPTVDFQGEGLLEYGSYNSLLEKASVSGPVTSDGSLLFRLSQSYRRRGAYGENLNGKEAPGAIDTGGFRGQLEYRNEEKGLTALLSADIFRGRNGQSLQVETTPNISANVNPALPVLPGQTFYDRYFDYIGLENQDAHNISGRVELKTPLGLVTSISAYRYNSFRRNQDNDATNYDGQVQIYREKDKTFSQELRLVGDALDRLHYVVGGYFYHADTDFTAQINFGRNYPLAFLSGAKIVDISAFTTDSYAAFGQLTVDLTRQLSLTFGGRYSKDDKENQRTNNRFGAIFTVDPKPSFSDFTPAVTLNYKPVSGVLTYFSYREGFKSGGFQTIFPASAAIANTPFLPEHVTSFELGAKTTFLEHRVVLDAALFRSDIDNQQVTRITPLTATSPSFTQIDNAGRTQADGLDVSLTVRPIRQLTLSASATFQDARYLQYVTNGVSLAGKRQTRSPDFTGYFSAQYDLPLGAAGDLILFGEYSRRSNIYFDPANTATPGLFQPDYGIGNLRITFRPAQKPFDVSFFVRNVGDAHYYQNIVVTAPSGIGAPGEPRTFGGSLSVRF